MNMKSLFFLLALSLLAASPARSVEPIGKRIIEVPKDVELTELRGREKIQGYDVKTVISY